MTGKFTENVHNLGHATGELLHRLFLSTARPGSAPAASACAPAGGRLPRALARLAARGRRDLDLDLRSAPPALLAALRRLPRRYGAWWLDLLRSDPLHVLVETLLIVACLALVATQRRADWRFGQERRRDAPTEEEAEELLREWKATRAPLGGAGDRVGRGAAGAAGAGTGPVVERIAGGRLYFQRAEGGGGGEGGGNEGGGGQDTTPRSALNFATHDYLSSSSSPASRAVADAALRRYGCGSCGPRGFYGTIDAHLEAEAAVAAFLGTEGAILYSDGASAATSTVAAFAKRGDLLIVDEGAGEALLAGVTLSRATVRYFRHNDTGDLRRVLEKVRTQDRALRRRPTDQRRFLVAEGLYRNWGSLAPLRELVALKEEFGYRLLLDDSHGVGVLGARGRGSLEHHGLRPQEHCEILTFSLEHALGSVGGMTVGSEEVVDHQRLSGAGYCFSASAPPFLSKVCLANVRRLEGRLEEVLQDTKERGLGREDVEGNEPEEEEGECAEEDALNMEYVKGEERTSKLANRGSPVPGDGAALPPRRGAPRAPRPSAAEGELSGPALLARLHRNVRDLHAALSDPAHPHAAKLRDRLVITSHPLSPLVYLRVADGAAAGRDRAALTALLDRIARHCLEEGGVALVSTGGHVARDLRRVPPPCLRLAVHAGQTREDAEAAVRALGAAVERVLGRGAGRGAE